MENKLRIVFFGTSSFTASVLVVLKKKFNLIASFTSTIQKIDKKNLEKLKPDLFIVASFGKILKKEILEIPRYGAINIHPSLLPKYRGASPIQMTILNDDEKTGITIIKMDKKVDHGPILFQKEERISPSETFQTLAERLFMIGADNLYQVIRKFIKGDLKPIPQDDSIATFTKLIKKADGQIELNNLPLSDKLDRMIRAYFPWPGVFLKTKLNKKEKIIKLLPNKQIQVEGKKPMSYKDFINGYKEGKGILRKLNLS